MSQPLKEAAPVGSLAARVLEEKPIAPSTRRQLVSVSQGWRSEGFRSASEKLSAASSRLQTEAEHESQFWEQVAKCRAEGWPISRLPRDRKAIGVHFGFAEAATQFRDRGFALLLQAADGSVGLDGRLLPKSRKRLAVYVVRNGIKAGAFRSESSAMEETADISQQLAEHRDALFHEELFYEICREARLVANQGVTTREHTVEIDVKDYQLLLVSSDEHEPTPSTTEKDDCIAGFVSIALRLMLNAAHEKNLKRRSQAMPPMINKARPLPEYALIRPILNHLRHRAEANAFWNGCQVLLRPLEKASLPIKLSMESTVDTVFKSVEIEPPDTILSRLTVPAKTAFKLSLIDGRTLSVGLATFLGTPLLGSRYETSAIDFGFSELPFTRHETREAIMAFVGHIILLDLVAHTERLTRSGGEPVGDKSKREEWSVSQPHGGELTKYVSQEAVHKMQLSVKSGSLHVKLSSVKRRPGHDKVVWTWTGVDCSKAQGNTIVKDEDMTFDEAIKQLIVEGS